MSNEPTMSSWWQDSYLTGGNAAYLEAMLEAYLADPQSVSTEWRQYFSQLNIKPNAQDFTPAQWRESFKQAAQHPNTAANAVVSADTFQIKKEHAVSELIHNYRNHGHRLANLDPLGLLERQAMPALELSYHHLSDADLTTPFYAGVEVGMANAKLADVIEMLRQTYCSDIGVEYMHISNEEEVRWLQERMETTRNQANFSAAEKKDILKKLIAAEGLEKYLGSKYVGQKRFSLEGGESLIPLCWTLINDAGQQGVKEMVFGMAHRGRLNVLMNVLGKKANDLFNEFEGKYSADVSRSGDVKYHLGFSSNVETPGGITHLALAFNPSHLEIVSAVVEGSVRARQRRRKDKAREQVLAVLMHGDAAFAGQGVVMEIFNFSQARGFCTGGSVHIVINNQVGFTTSNPLDARSTLYCTDVAKMVQAPIFHVNGDDPEAVCFVTKLAIDYRMRFHKDVVIDLVCYRKHGHNEADEPIATQPLMYQAIRKHPSVVELYSQQLIKEKVLSESEVTAEEEQYRRLLDSGESLIKTVDTPPDELYAVDWAPYINNPNLNVKTNTAVAEKTLIHLAKKLETLPQGFKLQAQVEKLMQTRAEMTEGKQAINWGYAETLAYASLLEEGHGVRISGQDASRGTFAHRHAELHNQVDGSTYVPLSNLSDKQAPFIIIDSVLSEVSVLGFEYGFSSSEPNALVIWEAQFGDFANCAQVVVDQFLSSGEQKWDRYCGLTMLLPHGYEGMGPEHSSARLERYLQLCAQQNMSVCSPTTPAQIFHLLRRQVIRLARKPLIVMTPKSILRHKLAVSTLEDLAKGEFQLVIQEIDDLPLAKVKKVVLCSGKVYYDLLEKRREDKISDIAIVRIEQLYPFPREELIAALNHYPNAKHVVWCQEEPMNQGAWYQINFHLRACTVDRGLELDYAGRSAQAAPAAGSSNRHKVEQAGLVAAALA